jgi:hypothetical protein
MNDIEIFLNPYLSCLAILLLSPISILPSPVLFVKMECGTNWSVTTASGWINNSRKQLLLINSSITVAVTAVETAVKKAEAAVIRQLLPEAESCSH